MENKYFRVEINAVEKGKTYDTSITNYGDNFKNDYYDHFLKSYFVLLDQINLPVDFLVSVTNQIIGMGDMYTDILMNAIDLEDNIVLYKVTKNEQHKNYKVPVALMGEFLQSFENNFIYFDNGAVLWEAFFEKVRAKEFPNLPSRMKSIFLFGNAESCDFYKKHHCNENGTIVQLELSRTEKIFEADMKIVDEIENWVSRDDLIEAIRKYWKGEKTKTPINEYIFQGEYKILEKI